jgi:hypothetical protein
MRLEKQGPGSYLLDGEKALSVTTILDLALPKPALINWAAETTADYAIDNWDELSGLRPSVRLARLKRARWDTTRRAALRGTRLHKVAEAMSHGEEVHVEDADVGPAKAVAKWLDDWGVETIATESPCFHEGYRIVGTTDLVARIPRLSDQPILLDYKTGKGVYESDALQLCAYAHMTHWQPRPDVEEPMPELAAAWVVHVGPDDVTLHPLDIGPKVWETYLYLTAVARFLGPKPRLVGEGELLGSVEHPPPPDEAAS